MATVIAKLDIKGQQVPAVGLGTWTLSGKECIESVGYALSLGYRHIDTAESYGNQEEIGRAILNSDVDRKDIFLVSKVSPGNFEYDLTVRSANKSLEQLGTEYVDLLLMHWPNPGVPIEETLDAMAELQQKGKVRHIGLSNFPPSMVEEASRYSSILCNQIEYHPYLSQDKLIRQSRELDYLVTAYCPLAKGRVSNDSQLNEIGEKYGKSPAQVALRWIVQQSLAAIPKSSSRKHIEENIRIFDFELSDEEMKTVHSLERGLHLDPVSRYAEET